MKATELIRNRIKGFESKESKDYGVIPTPFETINSKIGGFKKGELTFIAGRSGMGTTTLAVQIACEVSSLVSSAENVLFVSLDNSEGWMADKILSLRHKVALRDLRYGKLDGLYDKLDFDEQCFTKGSFEFDITFESRSISDFDSTLEINNYNVIIIDYIYGFWHLEKDYEHSVVSNIRKLKRIAKEKNIAIILTGSVGWMVEERGGDKRPILADIRYPEASEEYFDKVFMLYRPEYYDITEDWEGNSMLNKAELYLVKNSSGPFCSSYLNIDENFTHFYESEPVTYN